MRQQAAIAGVLLGIAGTLAVGMWIGGPGSEGQSVVGWYDHVWTIGTIAISP